METNYTLKKLIRGGTALLFLLAFMLSGTLSAVAQNRAATDVVLKIDGPGEVTVFYSSTDSEKFQNFQTDDVLSVDLPPGLQTGQVITFNATDLIDCYTFIDWQWDNVQNFILNDDELEITLPTTSGITVVTATFRYDYLEPEFTYETEFCEDEEVQIAIDGLADYELPMTATYTYFDGTTTTTNTTILDNGDLLVDALFAPGTYTFVLTHLVDAKGCVIEEPITIGSLVVNPLPLPEIAVEPEYCADEVIEPTVSGDNFGTNPSINWAIFDGDGDTVATSALENPTFGPLVAGDYIIEVSVKNGETDCVGTVTEPFTVNPLPVVTGISAPEVCDGEDVFPEIDWDDLAAGNATPTFSWAAASGIVIGGDTATPTITDADVGIHTMSLTITNGYLCSTTVTGTYTVNPLPEFDIVVADVCFGLDVVATITNTANIDPADSTYDWLLYVDGGGTVAFDDAGPSITITTPPVGVHTLVLTVTNENNCVGVATETFEVFGLPAFTIEGGPETCANVTETFSLDNQVNFVENNIVEWYVDGALVDTQTNTYTFVFDPALFGNVTETLSYVIGAFVTNGNDCESGLVTTTLTVNGLPFVTKNVINPPKFPAHPDGDVKTVWCTASPEGLVILGQDDVEWSPEEADCDPMYRWRKSTDDGATWQSTGDAAEFSRSYTLPELTQTTWYKRQVSLDCTPCDPFEEWVDSNIIKMIILEDDHFDVTAAVSDDNVCVEDVVTVTGTEPMEFTIGGVWSYTGPEGGVFDDPSNYTSTFSVTQGGIYEVTWTVTEEDIVANCGGPEHASEPVVVVFEDIDLGPANNLGLPEMICLDADPVNVVFPEFFPIPETLSVTTTVDGPGIDCGSPCTFDPAVAGVGIHTIVFTATTPAGCEETATATVRVIPLPQVAISADPAEACFGETVEIFSVVTSTVTVELQWWTAESDGTPIEPIDGAIDETYITDVSGFFVLAVQELDCSLVVSDVVEVTISLLEGVEIATTDKLEWCADEDISVLLTSTLIGTTPEGSVLTYGWYLNDVFIEGATDPTYIATEPGDYHLKLIEQFGAASCGPWYVGPITVIEHPLPEFDIAVENVCFGEPLEAAVDIIDNIEVASSTFEWVLYVDGGGTVPFTGTAISFENPPVGDHLLELTVTNENGCDDVVEVPFIVHPLPEAVVADLDEICYNETQALSLEVEEIATLFGSTYTVTWKATAYTAGMEPDDDNIEHDELILGVVTDTTAFTFDPQDYHGFLKYETWYIDIFATIENQWGCEYTTEKELLKINNLPFIVNNEIKNPQIDQVEKYIFCDLIPKDLITINSQTIPTVNEGQCEDIQYRWRFREWVDGAWTAWSSVGASYTGANLVVPAEFTNTVQFRREVRGIDCECDYEDGFSEWFPSNVVTLYVVDHIVAEILEAGPVCHDDIMNIEGNLLSVPVMDDEGEPTGEYFTYVTGEWTADPGVTIADDTAAVTTISADEPGNFNLNWALTPVSVVYAECSSNNPLYCCSGDDIDETVIFEELTVPAIEELPDVVCLSNTAVTLPYIETASGQTPNVTVDVYRDGDKIVSDFSVNANFLGEYIYTLPTSADGGDFTIVFKVELNECEAQRVIEFERIPHWVEAYNKYVCYEEGVDREIDYVAFEDPRYILQYQYRVNPASLFGTVGYSPWVDVPEEGLPTFTDPAVYQVRLRYRTEDPIVCTGPITTVVLEILPNISDIAFVGDACYDEEIEIEVTHSLGVTFMEWSITGATEDSGSTSVSSNVTKTSVDFAPGALNVGVHEFTATVYRQLPGGTEVCEFTFTQELTVIPPVYAVFSPNYRKNADGNIIYIEDVPGVPAQEAADGTTPPYVVNVPVSIVNSGGLYIDFSTEVADLLGDQLSGEDQGEFVILQKNVDGVWANVDIKVTYANPGLTPDAGYQAANRAVVRPYDFVNQEFLELEFNTEYRLMHNNVYKTSCGEGDLLEYRLSKIWDGGQYVYDEDNTTAYSNVVYTDDFGSNKVYFRTLSEAYANLPSVFPIGDDGRCDEIVVEFVNPVRYRANQFITPDGSQFKYKFDLEKRAFGSTNWVTQDIIDFVQPENFETVVGDVAGPTRMVIHLNPGVELDYGADYRIRMVPSNVNNEVVYGFWDLVLGVPVLDKEYDFDTYNNGIGTGWHWSTSRYYPVVFDLAGPDDEFGTRPDNHNNVTFSHTHPNLVTYPPVNGEFDLEIQEDPYHVDFYGDNFSVTAVPGEGYRFIRWKRSENGGDSFQNLATTGQWWQTEGWHYFPQTFTWRPDTFLVRPNSFTPANLQVWLHPNCEQELVYAAEFAKKTYTVRARPVEEGSTIVNNDLGTVSVDNQNVSASGRVHGSTVTLRATPKEGYMFVGWNLSALPPGFTGEATEIYTPPVFDNIMDPLDHTAVLELEILGEMPHLSTLDVYAEFVVFNPRIYAAAQGLKYDGSLDPNISNIQITVIDVASNLLDQGQEPVHAFDYDDFNFFEWSQIRYGNPTSPPGSQPWPISLMPLSVSCEYEFDKWERFDWTVIGEDEDGPIYIGWREIDPEEDNITINEVDPSLIQFIPVENYRLRAQFVWREDVDVDVVVYTNDTYSYGDDYEVEYGGATIEVEFDGPREDGTRADGSRDRWINGVPHPNNVFFTESLSDTELWPDDELLITVYPEANYYTYYWKDQDGEEVVSDECASPLVSSITLVDRFSGGGTPDRSVWRYKVGCDDIKLQAVLKVKRFEVSITATNEAGALVQTGPTQQGYFAGVEPLYHISQRKFNCDLGYVSGNDERRGLGFVRTWPTFATTRPAQFKGYFEKYVEGQDTYSAFTATAVGFYNSPANDQEWEYYDWQERIDGEWVTIQGTDSPTLEIDEIATNREFRARFKNNYEEPAYLLTVTDDIDDYTAEFTADATWPSDLGHPYYNAWQPSPFFKRNVVTLEKGFVAGYDFQTWVLEAGLVLEAPITLTDRDIFPELTGFINELEDDLEDDEIIELFLARETLKFRMPANAVDILASYDKHVYTITPIVRTHKTPHTLDCLDIDDILGGNAEDVTPEGSISYNYGEVIQLRGMANEGFTAINWMFGDINDCSEGGNNALTGWQFSPNDLTTFGFADGWVEGFEFRIPRLDQRDLDPDIGIPIYMIVAETPANQPYPYYDLEVTTDAVDGTNGPWLLNGKDGVAAVKKVGEDYNDHPDDVWFGFSTETEAKFAHGNTAKVWVLEEDIRPGYEFVEWSGAASGTDLEAEVYMDAEKEAIALFRAKQYQLYVSSNDYGTVSVLGRETAPFDWTNYTIEDPAIKVAGLADDVDDTYEYRLLGFYYDPGYEHPVIDFEGEVVLDLDEEAFYDGLIDGVEEFDFFHTTIIPSLIPGANFDDVIWIYAKFAKREIGYTITLETRIFEDTEYNPEILADTYLALDGVETDSGVFDFEDVVEVSTEPDWGFEFKHWKYKDGSVIIPEMTYFHLVDTTATLVAVFKPLEYQLNVVAEEGGEVAGTGTFTRLDAPVVEVTSVDDGWAFAGWAEEDDLPEGVDPLEPSFVYEVTEDVIDAGAVTFTATFEQILYTVTFIVTDADDDPVEGALVTLTETPYSGVTDADGIVVFADLLGEYDYEVSKAGLSTIAGDFDVNFATVDEDGNLDVFVQFTECPKPSDLMAYVTAKTAFVTWDGGDADTWQVRVNGGDWTTVTEVGRLYTGLPVSPTFTYTYEVRTVCEGGGNSEPISTVFTTLAMGDVNADGVIDETDLTLMIAFMNNDAETLAARIDTADQLVDFEGTPFIFDAADIDGNGVINILDLVQWVNIDKDNDEDKSMSSDAGAILIDGSTISLDSDGTLTAIQFELSGRNLDMVEMSLNVQGHQLFWNVNGDILTGFMVSRDNKPFEKGVIELFEMEHADALEWKDVFAANTNGHKVSVDVYDISTDIPDTFASELSVSVFPNPSSGQFTSKVDVPANSNVTLRLYDLSGRQVAIKELTVSGVEHVSWNENLNPGMYILRMNATPEGQTDLTVTREVRVLIN